MKELDIEILINRENILSNNYIPNNLVILDNNENNFHNYIDPNLKPMVRADIISDLLNMLEEAKKNGYQIIVDSGYRSYDYQKEILNKKIEEVGKEKAYHIVAIPGSSEHQTGLCIDIAYLYNEIYNDNVTENDEEVKWLIKNSYKYGFILRYPKGKEEITGYIFEPWHYRYVGKKLAKILHKNNQTLEEYYKKSIKKPNI